MFKQKLIARKVSFLLIPAAVLSFSCTHDPQGIADLEPVCFESQIKPLIQNSCAVSGCHDATTAKEGYNFSSYDGIVAAVKPGNARQSELYKVLTDIYGEMMPPHQPLSEDDRNLIKIWIEQGAQNTTCGGLSGIPGQNRDTVCFNLDILPLLSSSCATAGCHDNTTAEEGYRMSSYANIVQNSNLVKKGNYPDSKLYKVLVDNGDDRMPPAPANRLTFDQIEKIKIWIAQGALNSNCVVAACDTSGTISYASQIWPIIQNNCLGCHPATGTTNNVSLGNHTQIAAVARTMRNGISLLSGSIHQQTGFKPMPQNGMLDKCKIATIDKWISQGMANN